MPKCRTCGKESGYALCDSCCAKEKEKNLEVLYHIEEANVDRSPCHICGGSGTVVGPRGNSFSCSCSRSNRD